MISKPELEALRGIRIHALLGVPDKGRDITIKCPFHSEHTPSFVLYENGGYYCFGCKATGQNCIDFTMALGFTFEQTIEELRKLCRGRLDQMGKLST